MIRAESLMLRYWPAVVMALAAWIVMIAVVWSIASVL